jgi:hypothetical protein
MSDRLHLAFWLRGYSPLLVPSVFRKTLGEFPFSKLRTGGTLKALAIDEHEPPVLEAMIEDLSRPEEAVAEVQEFYHSDTALRIEAWWDLWRWDGDWNLLPSPVTIDVYGPEYERELDEHIAFDLGPESLYLPVAGTPVSHKPVESNLRSVLHLIRDLEGLLAVDRRLLWSESGENFAGRLKTLLG